MARQPSRPTNARRTSTQQRRRQHVLENVTVRAHQASRQRRQWLFNILSWMLIVAAVGVAGFFGGRKLLTRFFFKNPDYNLSILEAQSDGILTADDILGAADLQKGTNIFKVDLERARARLAALPQVEKVQVSRQLPNRVSIQINERKPIAWIAPEGAGPREEVVASKKSYFIDANGILLPPKKVQQQDTYLPIIRHYTGPVTLGQEADGDEMRATLDLLHAQADSLVTARYQIEEIDLSKHFGLLVTARGGARVLLPLDDMDMQLKRMDNYMQGAEARGEKVDTLNLLVKNNVPVTFQPAPTPPPPDPAQAAASPSPSPAGSSSKSSGAGKKDSQSKKGKGSNRSGGKSSERSNKSSDHASKPAAHKDSVPTHPAPAAPAHSPAPSSAPGAPALQPFH